MKRVARVAATIATGGLVLSLLPAASGAPGSSVTTSTVVASSSSASADERLTYKPRKRFAREFVRRGDVDRSPYDMKHVRELQYRLTWAGTYNGPMTGRFDSRLVGAVKRFQKRSNLRITGAANVHTWKKLIPKTVRGKNAVPRRCKRAGWHACYDRSRHQVTLWRRGKLWNSWLVRGGMASTQTRVGRFEVYYRNKDHVSSLFGSPMPNSQFFSGGQAFHGSTLMMNPFVGHSHGCVNMYIKDSRQLWKLTADRELKVRVYGAWS
ncbi:MAG: L,D-transpeptidase family protein [Actinomycetota bacterium]|nr:L,D-transpeptidase family protein [Actinomycetota bacterium]